MSLLLWFEAKWKITRMKHKRNVYWMGSHESVSIGGNIISMHILISFHRIEFRMHVPQCNFFTANTTIAAIIAIAFAIFTAIGYILHDAIEKLFFFSRILLTKLCYVFPSDTIFWTLSLSFCSSIFHRFPIGFRVMFFCLSLSLSPCLWLPSPVLWIVVRCLPFVFLVAHPLCHAMCLLVRLLFPKPLRKCQ